jgi:hypothetical protein
LLPGGSSLRSRCGVDLLRAVGKDTPKSTTNTAVTEKHNSIRTMIVRELALFLGFFFAGLVLLPIAIYLVGQAIFGDYGGGSYGHFYSELSGRFRAGDAAAWFLVLSPYLGWQTLRLIGLGWRMAGRRPVPGQQ